MSGSYKALLDENAPHFARTATRLFRYASLPRWAAAAALTPAEIGALGWR